MTCLLKLFYLIILICLIYIICVLKCENKDTLEMVHVIFRHGERTPDTFPLYPSDPYINHTYYPYGHGQLTNKGKNEMYLLGKVLRQKYDTLLGPLYTPDILDSASTDANRTKMSLQLVLAGLFPPHKTDLEWEKELNWQPISYNHLSQRSDNTVLIPFLYCQKYISLFRSLENTAHGVAFYKKYSKLYHYLGDHIGISNVSLMHILTVYGTLRAQDSYGLILPSWTKEIYPTKLEEYMGDFFVYSSLTNELKQLSGGFLLKKIIYDTIEKIDYNIKPSSPKIFLYATHDIQVIYLLSAMDVYFPHQPPYAAYTIIEVHKIDDVPGIKIFYQDYSLEEPKMLKVPGCDYFCPFKEFILLLKKNLPVSDDSCKLDTALDSVQKDIIPK